MNRSNYYKNNKFLHTAAAVFLLLQNLFFVMPVSAEGITAEPDNTDTVLNEQSEPSGQTEEIDEPVEIQNSKEDITETTSAGPASDPEAQLEPEEEEPEVVETNSQDLTDSSDSETMTPTEPQDTETLPKEPEPAVSVPDEEDNDTVSESKPTEEASAEEILPEDAGTDQEKEHTETYDHSFITQFINGGTETLHYDIKPALISLQEDFPDSLTVMTGGTVTCTVDEEGNSAILSQTGGEQQILPVSWVCAENYDETLAEYHFYPEIESFEIIEGLELPCITVTADQNPSGPIGGYIPQELEYDVPILDDGAKNEEFLLLGAAPLPEKYDSFEQGILPVVRNQGGDGSCWSFATMGALEADLIRDGAVTKDAADLSELHLLYFSSHTYTDPKNCNIGDEAVFKGSGSYVGNGGNPVIATRTLMNLVGAAAETDAPYDSRSTYHPDPLDAKTKTAVQMTGAYHINTSDRDHIKEAILEHGAVSASMWATEGTYSYGKAYYSGTYNSFYGTVEKSNHAILLVGWDDNFPKEHFHSSCLPQEDGAWLVRNSWGLDGYGLSGYFWLSYADSGLNSEESVTAFDASLEVYEHSYGYANVPFPSVIGSVKTTNKATLKQTFHADCNLQPEEIKAIGIETATPNLSLTIRVTNKMENVTSEASYSTTYTGFYLIPLNTPLQIFEASDIEVEITMTASSGPIQIVYEKPGEKDVGSIHYTAAMGSDGLTINNSKTNSDGRITLYSDDIDPSLLSDCTVIHQWENLDGTFLEETEIKRRLINSDTIPSVKTHSGFISPQPQSVHIDADGSASVTYVYRRKTFQVNGTKGTGIKTISGTGGYLYGAAVRLGYELLPGYQFSGWSGYTDSAAFEMPDHDVQMKAAGKPITYSITYLLDGGTNASNPQAYNVASENITLNAPKKEGYVFIGWSGTGLSGIQNRNVTIPKGSTGNRIYSAHWVKETINMYRMYNPNSGEHFYTGNAAERDHLVSVGWNYEGVGFKAPKTSKTPMYRLYNPNAGDHHYTYNVAEKNHLISVGWNYEGIGWYADDNKEVPQYRLYNPNATGAGSHHYTSNVAERDHLIGLGWKDEGIGFYTCK